VSMNNLIASPGIDGIDSVSSGGIVFGFYTGSGGASSMSISDATLTNFTSGTGGSSSTSAGGDGGAIYGFYTAPGSTTNKSGTISFTLDLPGTGGTGTPNGADGISLEDGP
jgi:hypothetical protein